MSVIELNITNNTSNGGCHARLMIDGGDCGVLYLTSKEHELLDAVFSASDQTGACMYRKALDEESV